MAQVKMEIVKDGGWKLIPVVFASARQAIEWMDSHDAMATWLHETEDRQITEPGRIGPFTADELELHERLYPTCHHGMSAELCMDPVGDNHWGTIEQELAGQL